MIKFRHFVKEAFKLTFILIVILSVLSIFDFYSDYIFFSWLSLFFLLFLTLLSGYYNTRSLHKRFFINIFLGTLTVKFFLCIIYVALYFFVMPFKVTLIIPFLLLFIIYKGFETGLLLKYSRDVAQSAQIKKEGD